ncbi:MAG: CFI-box-CTERM domain-containing protein [Roseateles sp.]
MQVNTSGGASDIDYVVRATKQLRQRLVDELGAQGLSLHECLDALVGRLPEPDMRRLRFIATVRNKIINEVGNDTLDNRPSFVQAVDQANASITAHAAAWRSRGSTQAAGSPKSSAGCFIATAVYPDPDAPQLGVLRRYRDQSLMQSAPGRVGVNLYYRLSPPVADWLSRHPRCAALVRSVLNMWVRRLTRD